MKKKKHESLGHPFRRPRHITRRTISEGKLTNHQRVMEWRNRKRKSLLEDFKKFAHLQLNQQ